MPEFKLKTKKQIKKKYYQQNVKKKNIVDIVSKTHMYFVAEMSSEVLVLTS